MEITEEEFSLMKSIIELNLKKTKVCQNSKKNLEKFSFDEIFAILSSSDDQIHLINLIQFLEINKIKFKEENLQYLVEEIT